MQRRSKRCCRNYIRRLLIYVKSKEFSSYEEAETEKGDINLQKGISAEKAPCLKTANQAVIKSAMYAYRDRRNKKRNFRQLGSPESMQQQVMNGMSYSTLYCMVSKVNGMRSTGKFLADMAVK